MYVTSLREYSEGYKFPASQDSILCHWDTATLSKTLFQATFTSLFLRL